MREVLLLRNTKKTNPGDITWPLGQLEANTTVLCGSVTLVMNWKKAISLEISLVRMRVDFNKSLFV